MLARLDPHTAFLEPDEFSAMREKQHGSFYGLGIQIQKRMGKITVIAPMEGTPAYKMGIRAGDIITHIAEEELKEDTTTEDVVRKLRGPKGTTVAITIRRVGFDEPIRMTITRAEIPTRSVRYAFMLEPGVGYIMLSDFTHTSSKEVYDAIQKLEKQGMKKLLLDLRGNPGGVLEQAVDVTDVFVPKGSMVTYTKGRTASSAQEYYAPGEGTHFDHPLVVLVNRGSASASEIVAGAIQDHDRGVIVGQRTWGKGLVQSVYTLSYGAGLALTTARYYTPSGRWIQRDYTDLLAYVNPGDPDAGAETSETAPHPGSESAVFYTDAGRVVYAQGGITPDVDRQERDRDSKLLAAAAGAVRVLQLRRRLARPQSQGRRGLRGDPRGPRRVLPVRREVVAVLDRRGAQAGIGRGPQPQPRGSRDPDRDRQRPLRPRGRAGRPSPRGPPDPEGPDALRRGGPDRGPAPEAEPRPRVEILGPGPPFSRVFIVSLRARTSSTNSRTAPRPAGMLEHDSGPPSGRAATRRRDRRRIPPPRAGERPARRRRSRAVSARVSPQRRQRDLVAGELVLDPLVAEADARGPGRGPRVASDSAARDPGDLETRRESHLDAVAVLRVEDLELAAPVVDVEAAVRQDPVHVEEEGLDHRGAGGTHAGRFRVTRSRPTGGRAGEPRPSAARPRPRAKSEVIFASSILASAVEANSSGSTVLGFAWRQSRALPESSAGFDSRRRRRSPSEMTPRRRPRTVGDGRDPHHLAGHLVDRLGHRGVRTDGGEPLSGAHQVFDLEEPAAELAARVEGREVLLLEAPLLRNGHGQGVSQGEHGRRGGGRSEVQGTGLARDLDRGWSRRRPGRRRSPAVPVMAIVRSERDRANSSRRTTSGVSPE